MRIDTLNPLGVSKLTNQQTGRRDNSAAEQLITLRNAAEAIGVPYFKIQRAARNGLIPTYFVYNSRRLVRLSEVLAVINGTRRGGAV